MDLKQMNTANSFGYKWARRESYESQAFENKARDWMLAKYFGEPSRYDDFFEQLGKIDVLDAGCGSGRYAEIFFRKIFNQINYTGVDISDAVEVAKQRFSEMNIQGNFIRGDLCSVNLNQEFDVIFCEGVLHHVSNPQEAFRNLWRHLRPNGYLFFYVYKKKAPLREWSDDFIRKELSSLDDESAWNKIMSLTKLGKILGDNDIQITLDEDVELLKIPKGKHSLQRLIYWYFLKIYYDPNFTLDEMNHINFDWFRPEICFRYEPDEIKSWLKCESHRIERFHVEDAGISVVVQKL